jgi:cyclopropane-fatty-acyl-phospholipid synthase
MGGAKTAIENLLAGADIKINGGRPWDIKVRDEEFYRAVLRGGSLAFGEGYMSKQWDCDAVDELIYRIFLHDLASKVRFTPANIALYLRALVSNSGRKGKAFEIGQKHYDIGNDLFKRMLDDRMTYTCGYWKNAKNLNEAQEAKLDLVCRKLGLKAGQTVLDIGCGWGSFMKFAAEKYGVHVTGVTVSKEQVDLGREMCKGLPVEFRLQDYRDIKGSFDHVVSLGMFEHVVYKNYRTYFRVVRDCLKDDGLFLLHTIGTDDPGMAVDPWINKYIFPNGKLPMATQIDVAREKLFVMEDWHNFGADYDRTLMAWFDNFDEHWPEIAPQYSETFYRMWKFYLLSCAGSFRARNIQLWQIVFSKHGVPGGYQSVR